MNYIKKLQLDNGELKNDIKRIDEEVNDLLRYLHSTKFHQDTTVQVSDVVLRLSGIREILLKNKED